MLKDIEVFSKTYKEKLKYYLKRLNIADDLKQKALTELSETKLIRLENLCYIDYTLKHKLAIKLLYHELETDILDALYSKESILLKKEYFIREMIKQLDRHDVDKLVMYMFLTKKTASEIHRKTKSHHLVSSSKSLFTHIEMILDWECAYLTKDDKPLNAYDTLLKLKSIDSISNYDFKEISNYLNKAKLGYSYNVREKYKDVFTSLNYFTFSLDDVMNSVKEYYR